jgi:predicted  nucleic acid-binding Zn-ribbon protein
MEQEIRNLESQLSCTTSDIGDWKIAKAMEYQLVGKDLPYDIKELNQKRQAVRDRINELQKAIEELPEEESKETSEE